MTNKISARRHHLRKSLKARTNATRRLSEKAADWMTSQFGTVLFLNLNILFFLIWIVANVGLFGNARVIDPYPFGLLTLIVSLEAIVLSIVVIISQNRQARIADLREEMDFYINLISEREVTKVLNLLGLLLEKNGVDLSNDPEVRKMMEPISAEEIEEQFKEEILEET